MFTIKVWCLPGNTSEDVLKTIHQGLVAAVVSFEALQAVGLKDQNSMLVLFPSDLMKYGAGEEILIEATDLNDSVDLEVRKKLASKLGMVVYGYFSGPHICCKISPRDRTDVVWEV